MTPFRKLRTALGLPWEKRQQLPVGVTVGRYTYGIRRSTFRRPDRPADIRIGAFCSFAREALLMQGGEHDRSTIANFPMEPGYFRDPSPRYMQSKGPIIIGNDVWIGRRAIIMSGVTVGHGAIVGAGAVAAKDIPPFAIAVGNPARVVKYRFSPETIAFLLDLAWWNWSDAKIRAHKSLFTGPSEEFLRAQGHNVRPKSPV